MKTKSTMQEVAKRAGVSLGTVSHVLNGSAGVSEALRSRVIDTVQELGYQPSQLGRGLRKNSTTMIGMFIPDIGNPFFPAVVRGAEDVVYQSEYHLALCNTDHDAAKEASYLKTLKSFLPAGLLVIPSVASDLEEPLPIATVCMDRTPRGWKRDSVTVDNTAGAFEATSYLLSMGHRTIGMIVGPLQYTNSADRLSGYRRAMSKIPRALSREYVQETTYNREGGRMSALRLLGLRPRPTAIFASNDLIALGVLSALRESGLRCPGDVSLIGFDGLEMTEFTAPSLTTVYQPGYQMGATAARILVDRILGDTSEVKEVVLGVELRVRGSVARLPDRRRSR